MPQAEQTIACLIRVWPLELGFADQTKPEMDKVEIVITLSNIASHASRIQKPRLALSQIDITDIIYTRKTSIRAAPLWHDPKLVLSTSKIWTQRLHYPTHYHVHLSHRSRAQRRVQYQVPHSHHLQNICRLKRHRPGSRRIHRARHRRSLSSLRWLFHHRVSAARPLAQRVGLDARNLQNEPPSLEAEP